MSKFTPKPSNSNRSNDSWKFQQKQTKDQYQKIAKHQNSLEEDVRKYWNNIYKGMTSQERQQVERIARAGSVDQLSSEEKKQFSQWENGFNQQFPHSYSSSVAIGSGFSFTLFALIIAQVSANQPTPGHGGNPPTPEVTTGFPVRVPTPSPIHVPTNAPAVTTRPTTRPTVTPTKTPSTPTPTQPVAPTSLTPTPAPQVVNGTTPVPTSSVESGQSKPLYENPEFYIPAAAGAGGVALGIAVPCVVNSCNKKGTALDSYLELSDQIDAQNKLLSHLAYALYKCYAQTTNGMVAMSDVKNLLTDPRNDQSTRASAFSMSEYASKLRGLNKELCSDTAVALAMQFATEIRTRLPVSPPKSPPSPEVEVSAASAEVDSMRHLVEPGSTNGANMLLTVGMIVTLRSFCQELKKKCINKEVVEAASLVDKNIEKVVNRPIAMPSSDENHASEREGEGDSLINKPSSAPKPNGRGKQLDEGKGQGSVVMDV